MPTVCMIYKFNVVGIYQNLENYYNIIIYVV